MTNTDHRVIVIEFVSLDGVVQDPDGSQGLPFGGWAFRHGPQAVAGDKFDLGPLLHSGVLLLGRATWQLFAGLWPTRTDPFSVAMNRIPKLVASRTLGDVSAWSNSKVLDGGLVEAVTAERAARDVILAGSTSIACTLASIGLVDEYRLLLFPSVIGSGERLFAEGNAPAAHFHLASAAARGETVLLTYARE